MRADGSQIVNAQLAGRKRSGFLYSFVKVLVRTIGVVLFGIKVVKGKNSLPEEGACILAGNHISMVDPVFLSAGQKRQVIYMAKAELFKNRLLGFLFRCYGSFPVERGSADMSSVNHALSLLDEGNVLGVFPEGTRSKTGEMGTGKSGTVMIAYRSGVPIYPFAVYCRKGLHLFCKYTIAFGEPVTAEQLGIVEGKNSEYRTATRALMKIIADLRSECIESRG